MVKDILAYRCHAISDDIGSITLDTVSIEDPGPGEVQINVKACSVNFPDLLMIQGKYQFKPPLPFAPGGEASGDVVAIGSEVSQVKEGDRVVFGSRHGCFAETPVSYTHLTLPTTPYV